MWRRKQIPRRSLVGNGRTRGSERRSNVCGAPKKRHCELPNVRRRRFRGDNLRLIRKNQDGKQARSMAGPVGGRFRIVWTRWWKFPYRAGVQIAGAG